MNAAAAGIPVRKARRVPLSVWLASAGPAEGGMSVPGRSRRAGCDLLIHPDGLRVTVDELSVDLPFEAFAGDHGWSLGPWTSTRGGSGIGVGVYGAGRFAAPVAALRRRRRTVATLVDRLADRSQVAPLHAAHVISPRVDADRAALEVLCGVLARRPRWRPQLADPARVTQLLRDLAGQDHGPRQTPTGFRRRDVETFTVMHRLRYEHPRQGRPLPDDVLPGPDEAVGAVLRELAANRYALPADEDHVRRVVHRHYLDVSPWPFTALVPDPA